MLLKGVALVSTNAIVSRSPWATLKVWVVSVQPAEFPSVVTEQLMVVAAWFL